jgi:NADPH2:quinone reductase
MVPVRARVARIHKPGGPGAIFLEEVDVPALRPGDVQVAVAAAGVNFPDILQRSGELPVPSLPYTLGFEAAGTIEAVGADVHNLAPGARIVAELPRGGGYATRIVVPARATLAIPHDISFAEAVTLFVTGRTALLMLRHACVMACETVVIPSALGGVGGLAVRLAKAMGARVIAMVGSETKRERALALGADAVVVARPGWSEELRMLTDSRGADVVFQSTGGHVGREGLRALAPLGRLIFFGADNVVRPEPLSADEIRALLSQAQSIGGFALMRLPAEVRARAFYELVQNVTRGELAVDITRYPLDAVREMHAAFSARATVGKVVLEP